MGYVKKLRILVESWAKARLQIPTVSMVLNAVSSHDIHQHKSEAKPGSTYHHLELKPD